MKFGEIEVIVKKPKKKTKDNKHLKYGFPIDAFNSDSVGESVFVESIRNEIESMFITENIDEEAAGVGIVTKQNATADVPVGGEYMNVKKLFPKKKKKKSNEDVDTTIDLNKALSTLDDRLKDIVLMRVKYNMTFKEIGGEINTGADRARQLYLRALRKLRHPKRGIMTQQDVDKYNDREGERLGWEKGVEFPGVQENFADGKVKGKSRPGRVKRAGASCNGSVTELRKKAKNASGEKAKMYHWCANMKSGKKK